MTPIRISKLATIGSDNGLSPGRCEAIIWTNAGILWIRTLGTNFSKIHPSSFKKTHLKMLSAKWWLLCLGHNVLIPSPVLILDYDWLTRAFLLKCLRQTCYMASLMWVMAWCHLISHVDPYSIWSYGVTSGQRVNTTESRIFQLYACALMHCHNKKIGTGFNYFNTKL